MVERPIKIAFIGTCCAGKTTLLNIYKQRYKERPSVLFVEEVARNFFSKKEIADSFTVEVQSEIQDLVLENEKSCHMQNSELIICDRSVIDPIVYLRARGNLKGGQTLLQKVRFWIPSYKKLFLLNPEGIPYKTDDIRKETPEERQLLHNTFLELLQEEGIAYELIQGTQEERIQRIDQVLSPILFKRINFT